MSDAGSIFMVGLPTVYPGPILDRIRAMGLPVLIFDQRHANRPFSYAQAWLGDWDAP
jgi:hypothetical protein